MDPMIDLVRDRTADLHRTAEAIRRDRAVQPDVADAAAADTLAVAFEAGAASDAQAPVLAATDLSCADAECVPVSARNAA
jgi:hypothetical protein